jgi:5-methyltetrahydropteroyltriglutamate--homocysteine methyltransferase
MGREIDESVAAEEGRATVRAIVPKQVEAGLDVINNGEQQRDSFALYLRHRLTGLGEGGTRHGWQDIDSYPEFKAQFLEQSTAKEAVSNTSFLPAAVAEVSYIDDAVIGDECGVFCEALRPMEERFTEAFLAAPSPGIVAAIVQNRHYIPRRSLIASSGLLRSSATRGGCWPAPTAASTRRLGVDG